MARVETAGEFYAARFLLGMAEAGFAPGMTWLISQWTPPSIHARALAGALVAASGSFSLAIAVLVSLLVLAMPAIALRSRAAQCRLGDILKRFRIRPPRRSVRPPFPRS